MHENFACLEIILLLATFESENPVVSGLSGFAGSVPSVYTYAIIAVITNPACSDAVTVNRTGCHTVRARLVFHLEWRVNLLHFLNITLPEEGFQAYLHSFSL